MEGNKVATASLVIVVIFLAGLVLKLAKPVLFPFFIAIFLTFILSPVLDLLTRLKIPRAISIVIVIIVAFSLIYLLGLIFFSGGKAFASEFPKYGQKFSSILASIQENLKLSRLERNPLEWLNQLDINKLGGFLLSSLGTFFTFISNLFLIFIFLVFILAGRGKTKTKIKNSFNASRGAKIIDVIQNIDSQIQKYLAIKTVVSFFTGVLATLVLLIFGVDFAIVFGFLTFLLNYIPNIGSIIATALPVVISIFQFETLWPAFWILIILTAIQMTMGNFIEPRLMGRGLGLSPLVILFSLFFWGWLWGLPGMILAVPITAIIKIVCNNIPSLQFVAALISKD